MTFMGLALMPQSMEQMKEWLEYFLNEKNHKSSALPLQWVSFHYYVQMPKTAPWKSIFQLADAEMESTVTAAVNARDHYNPQVLYIFFFCIKIIITELLYYYI